MKKIALIGLIVFLGIPLFGQMLGAAEYEHMQAHRSIQKRGLMEHFIELEGDSAIAYWKLMRNMS